ncbi:beta strand repeat-containing protein [Archangium lansingense]|uniref:beta strand repeat-containing protein n=1 Tax=Archangium lansingense TaxID=2995310 RepID=UPI003B7AFD3C
MEARYDGVYLVYSTTGASGPWTAVSDSVSTTQPYISAGGYDDVLTVSPNPRIWTSQSINANGSLKPVTVNLGALAGQKVWFGFRFHSGSINTVEGFYVDDVRVTADTATTCSTNVPPPGPAVAYTVTGLPATVSVGTQSTLTVSAVDAAGVAATSYSGSAALSSTDPRATLPSTAAFTAGVASIPVTFGTLGTQSVTVTETAGSGFSAAASTTVTPGAATRLSFTIQPANTVAGTSFTPALKVSLLDAYGNTVSTGSNSVTLAIGNNSGGGTLSGTATVAMSSGVATFSGLSIDKVGTGYTLAASSTGLTSATSSSFNITPAAVNKLAYVTQPSSVGAGAVITPPVRVALVDQFGNVTASTSSVTLTLSASPAGATLSGTTTVAAVNGVATFSNLSLNKMGTGNRLTATSGSLAGLASDLFEVTSAPPYRAIITRQPSSAVAGAPISPAVEVSLYDQLGNLATQANMPVSVSLGSNPSGGILGGTTTVNSVNGVATFDALWVNRAGVNYTLVAGASGLFLDTSVGFNVSVGAPARLAFISAPPASTASGAAFSARVEVQDSAGNRISSASPQVVLSLANAAGATLSGPTTVTAAGGVATFTGLSVDKAGSGYMLQADVAGLTSELSPAFGIVPGTPAAVSFLTQPGDTTAGTALNPAVRVAVKDAQGNTVTSSNTSVTLAFGNNPGGGVLSGSATAPAVAGVASFADLSINRVGAGYTLVASSGSLASDTSAGFDVKVGPAVRLVFGTAPANAVAGNVFAPVTVEILDAQGNVDTGATVDVTLTLGGPAGGTLGGTTTVTAVNGVASFPSLFINQAASGYTLSASAPGLNGVTSGTFDITPGAVSALAFTVQPANAAAGAAFAPVVKVAIQDAVGNVVASAQDEVTLSLASNPEGASLAGTLKVAAINGVATFSDLSVGKVGAGYTLVAASGTLTGATSSVFNVQPGSSSRLVFKTAPSNTAAGSVFAPIEVEIRDAYGNPVAAANSITLTLQGGSGGTLGGTTTVVASNGVAAFGDLSITQAAAGYRLTAHADGLVDVTSAAFDVSPGAAAALAFSVQPGVTQAGASVNPAVRVSIRDAFGNVVTGASDAITLSLSSNPGSATLAGTTTVAAVNGVATFTDLSLNRSARGYTLQASTGALPSVTSSAFEITTGAPARLVFRGTPSQVSAGATLAPIEVELRDALGNVLSDSTAQVTLSLGANPAAGLLFGAAPVSAVNGVAKFEGLSLRKAGTGYTLVASAQGFAGETSTALEVTPGSAASYALALPASVTAGQEVTVSTTAYDAYGNVATSYGGTVQVTSSDAAGVLPANVAFVEGVLSGLKVTFMSSGLRTLTLTDAEQASLSGVAQTNVTPFAQPTVAVTEPAGGTEVSGKVRISATGAVAAGTTPAQLSLLVDGVVIATGNEATLSAEWDSSKVPGGSAHTITAVFSDSAGNVVGSAPVGITVKPESCGCGAASGADASLYLGLFALARYVSMRRRRTQKAA